MEWMKKTYKTVGEGMLELCNASYSIAQATNLKEVCYCDSCIERLGKEELDRRSKAREEEIKKINFETLKEIFEKITFWDDEEDEYCPYNNWYNESVDKEGNSNLIKVKRYAFELDIVTFGGPSYTITLDAGMGARVLSVIKKTAWPITTWSENGIPAIADINEYKITNDTLTVCFGATVSQKYRIAVDVLYK